MVFKVALSILSVYYLLPKILILIFTFIYHFLLFFVALACLESGCFCAGDLNVGETQPHQGLKSLFGGQVFDKKK